jgi:hypothetical protein
MGGWQFGTENVKRLRKKSIAISYLVYQGLKMGSAANTPSHIVSEQVTKGQKKRGDDC